MLVSLPRRFAPSRVAALERLFRSRSRRRPSRLAGGCIVVGDGVVRELVSIATVRLADGAPADAAAWAQIARTMRSCSPPDGSGGERLQLPSDNDACLLLAAVLHSRAIKGRLLHCRTEVAELAVGRIQADVARRHLGLLG